MSTIAVSTGSLGLVTHPQPPYTKDEQIKAAARSGVRRLDERREVDFYHDCKPRLDERVDEQHCSAVEGSVGASHPPPNPQDTGRKIPGAWAWRPSRDFRETEWGSQLRPTIPSVFGPQGPADDWRPAGARAFRV